MSLIITLESAFIDTNTSGCILKTYGGIWRLEAWVVVAALVAKAAVSMAVTLAEVMVSLGIILCFQIFCLFFEKAFQTDGRMDRSARM